MRRWNGWGDGSLDYPLSEEAQEFLVELVGPAEPPSDADKQTALRRVPNSRLGHHSGISTDAELRLRHARGQSFPDWAALRFGRAGPFPDGVAQPQSHDEAATLLAYAKEQGVGVIPYGGGTSVVGHLNVPDDERPVLSLDLSHMNRLKHLDETARLARFDAGVAGPDLEAQLRAHGYMLGHFPQSFEYSTLGGWVVTRSSGQQSLKYGRIEDLFAGGRLAAPIGELNLPTMPASSAGPDIKELVMGSEGRFGILTEATVRVSPLPEHEAFHAVFLPDWDTGVAAVRELAQSGLDLSMLRLSNAVETETQLTLAGHPRILGLLRGYLGLRGTGEERCMLLMGVTGSKRDAYFALQEALGILRRHGGVHCGTFIGKGWEKGRFRGPYMRNSLWEAGYGVDTVETAVDWPRVTGLMRAMEQAAQAAFADEDEKVHAFTHLSHVYPQGSSIYSTFVFRAGSDLEANMQRWRRLKTKVSEAIVEDGGTISHQHGVGADHVPYLPAEKGSLGMGAIRQAAEYFDPDGIMNPGKLFV